MPAANLPQTHPLPAGASGTGSPLGSRSCPFARIAAEAAQPLPEAILPTVAGCAGKQRSIAIFRPMSAKTHNNPYEIITDIVLKWARHIYGYTVAIMRRYLQFPGRVGYY